MARPQQRIDKGSMSRILRSQGAAADQVASGALMRISGNPPPEESQHREVAVVAMDAGAAQFDHLGPVGFIRMKVEFLLAVIAEVAGGGGPRLQPATSPPPSLFPPLPHQKNAQRSQNSPL